ncbi:hypothetical protein [Jiangella sp. DSM 45060]|uniref:hypothetical protein n=1 Tax=Jiangella sp. DSM 45060 TaxID=1798224 RepID=UPI00087D9BBD|nr:hypothetical protein [Jiangella sp. DSM 45060]SDS95879.1 hypothetical protein SAMN04515669_2385 [Jiangella sp. DSM 45060]
MTVGDGRDDSFDLGVVGRGGDGGIGGEPGDDGPSGADEPGRRRWRRWAVPAVALVAGALIGTVVADARHDAAELARVGIVSGPSTWTPEAGGDGSVALDLQLVNIGSRPVEIVGVEADGFGVEPGTDPIDAVEAAAGVWVVVRQPGLLADCTAAAPTSLRVRVRDSGGDEHTVTADQHVDYGGIGMLWTEQCEFGGGYVQFAGPAAMTVADTSVTMTLPLLNYSGRSVRVTRMVPMAPGMAALPPELPIPLDGQGTAQVEVTWSVEDCVAALSMSGDAGLIEYSVAYGSMEVPESYPLDGPTMVELVRLANRVCG